ncbi:MAG: outer membrane protein transport protein [Flavobacteriaceae bacterium]|jgi:long-subunit fatty acid transport protein
MKRIIFLLGGLLSSLVINAQAISYTDAAVLFSSDDNNGTARYNGMSGAFGALGGDMSAVEINPAGLAIFKDTEFSTTVGLRNTDIMSNFYGTTNSNDDSYFNLHQVGGALVFNSRHSNWSKVAIGFNYTLLKDFENSYIVEGNSGISEFYSDPYLNDDGIPDNDVYYDFVDGQFFGNYTSGKNERFTFSLAAQYNDNLYLGFSLITHNLDFYQNALFEESNNDGNGNLLDASLLQELYSYGEGVGFGFGFITKPSHNIRFGLSYQTPVWYSLTDEFVEDLEISVSNNANLYTENSGVSVYDYKFNSPAKYTGSFAYVFEKQGLFSIDYTLKGYKNAKLKPTNEFINENDTFNNYMKNTSSVRIGGEWRVDNVSLRGGYHFEENPYKDALDSDNITGYSLGVGFKFRGNTKLDLAYQRSENTDVYGFLNIDGVAPAELDITNDKFTATLVIGF